MNPVFVFLVVLFAIFLWGALSTFFPNVGDVLLDMWDDIKRSWNKKE